MAAELWRPKRAKAPAIERVCGLTTSFFRTHNRAAAHPFNFSFRPRVTSSCLLAHINISVLLPFDLLFDVAGSEMAFNLIFSSMSFWGLFGPSPKSDRFSRGPTANKQPQSDRRRLGSVTLIARSRVGTSLFPVGTTPNQRLIGPVTGPIAMTSKH